MTCHALSCIAYIAILVQYNDVDVCDLYDTSGEAPGVDNGKQNIQRMIGDSHDSQVVETTEMWPACGEQLACGTYRGTNPDWFKLPDHCRVVMGIYIYIL